MLKQSPDIARAALRPVAASPTGRKRVLVVADRFPPSIHGGAEISLYLTLKAIDPEKYEIVIAALSDKHAVTTRESYDGFTIYRIPMSPHWAATITASTAKQQQSKNPLLRWVGKAEMAARYTLSRRSRRSIATRVRALRLYRRLSRANKLGWLPNMDADLLDLSPPVTALRSAIEAVKPDLIHADNYRSILIATAASPDATLLVAHVRDNRFFCTHRNQATHVGLTACSTCELKCVTNARLPGSDDVMAFMDEDRAVRRDALARANRVIVTSEYLREQVAAVTFAKPLHIVPNPSDDLTLVEQHQEGVERATPPEILIVGMVNQSKGQHRLPAWLPRLKAELRDFRVVLAGRGQLLTRIAKDVAKLGLSDHVLTPGFLRRDELYRAYARASVVLLPNVWPEPFGRVPLEAGLSARPVVAYALGGPKETIVHEFTGLLAPPQDETALIDHVVRLVRAPDLAHWMGANARERVRRNYTMDRAASMMSDVWTTCFAPASLPHDRAHDAAIAT